MAPLAIDVMERRSERRRSGGGGKWQADAVLRPGQPITLLNVCSRAALVESGARLRPGAQTELQVVGAGTRTGIRVRLDRCYVAALDPIRYRGVVVFEQRVDLGADFEGTDG